MELPWRILPFVVSALFLTPPTTEGAVFLSSEVSGTSVDPDNLCPEDRLVYTCTTTDGVLTWSVGVVTVGAFIGSQDDVGETRTPAALPGVEANLTAEDGMVLTSTLTIPSAGIDVANESSISCVDLGANINSTVLHIIGPPSVPTLSCVDLSEDTDGTVSVNASWTLSGGGSADFYLINITTNNPQPPYGGLLNISNASVTQRELTGFQAGYDYTITVRGVNCGGQEGNESEPLTITPQVPAIPVLDVCAVYDRTETLQTIESTWNEVDPVNVSANCVDGQDIRASYELSYTSSSGTSITTCVVDGTDCNNGVCRHELQNNTADSRCQPPVPQFNSESVTVTVTAGNIVGRSDSSEPRIISSMTLLTVYVDATNPENAFVNCMFESRYSCTIEYGTDRQSLVYSDTSSTLGQVATITLSLDLERDTPYYYIVSAVSSSQCVRMQGTFRTDCAVSGLGVTGAQDGMVDLRCADRQFVSNSPISNGVVCYNGTTAMSEAVYVCGDDFTLEGEAARVCQNDGNWNGTSPECIPDCTDSNLSSTGTQGGIVDPRCGRQFGRSLPISNGVVCYNGNTTMSEAVYICSSNFLLIGGATRVCRRNGTWSGTIPQCSVVVGVVVGAVVGAVVGVVVVGDDVGAIIVIILILKSFKNIKCLIITMIVILCLSVIGIPLAIVIAVWYSKKTDKGGTTGGAHHALDDTPDGACVTCCVILTIVLLCLSVVWIPVAIMIAVWYFKKTGDTEDTDGSPGDIKLKDVDIKGEEEQYSTLQHGKQPTSPDPLLPDPNYGRLGEHSEEAGDLYSQTRHGDIPHAVPNPEDQTYSHLKGGEGGGGGEEYSHIQHGKPARAVPNPNDPNYSRLKQGQGTRGASRPSAEELGGMYDEVGEGLRYKPSQKEEKEGKGKRKRQK